MIRTLLRAALVAALITGGSFLGSQSPASAAPSCLNGKTGPACKDPVKTFCNANSPGGARGCPRSGRTGPVCGNGKHKGNPHCRPGVDFDNDGDVDPADVRAASRRTTPRANKAVAPRRGAVSTKAGKAL